MTPTTRALALLGLFLSTGAAAADPCRTLTFEGDAYAVCEAAPGADLRLWLTGPDGKPMGTFDRLRDTLAGEGAEPAFAMNAGMYHPDRRPVGLYRDTQGDLAPLVERPGPGNFGMVPNGVFCIADRFAVIETQRFARETPACRYATQSGPMLVIDGRLHPRFLANSDSRYIRNGVGVTPDGRAVFAISDRPVTFHAFARLFRDGLGTPNALYFDGNISRLYAPELGRDDPGFPMGPIVGLVAPRD